MRSWRNCMTFSTTQKARIPNCSWLIIISLSCSCSLGKAPPATSTTADDEDPNNTTPNSGFVTAAATSSTATLPTDGSGHVSVSGEAGSASSTSESSGCSICFDFPQPECRIWDNDCPEGQKCSPFATGDIGNKADVTKCVLLPVEPKGLGEDCLIQQMDQTDNCDVGLLCVEPAPGIPKYCMKTCEGSRDQFSCSDPGYECFTDQLLVYAACLPACHPLTQRPFLPCERGAVCVPSNGTFDCLLDMSENGGQAYQSCSGVSTCKPGLMCVDSLFSSACDQNDASCCLPFCDLDDPSCLGPNEVCLALFSDNSSPPGFADLGLCREI